MSDQAEDQDVTTDGVAEPEAAATEPEPEVPETEPEASEPEIETPQTDVPETEPEASEPEIETPEPETGATKLEPEAEVADGVPATAATEAGSEPGRARRPSSLRAAATAASDIPRSKLTPPSFPGSPVFPGSDVRAPVSEPAEPGNSGEVSSSGPSLRQRLPVGKLPLNKLPTAKLPTGKLPVDKLSAPKLPDRDAVDKLRTLVKQRPEVGLGVAFAGGLIIATILKRLGRR